MDSEMKTDFGNRETDSFCLCCFTRGNHGNVSNEYYLGQKDVYEQMLRDTFDIQIVTCETGNTSNALICEQCISRLRDAFHFKEMVKQTQDKLLEMLKENCVKKEIKTEPIEFGIDVTEEQNDTIDDNENVANIGESSSRARAELTSDTIKTEREAMPGDLSSGHYGVCVPVENTDLLVKSESLKENTSRRGRPRKRKRGRPRTSSKTRAEQMREASRRYKQAHPEAVRNAKKRYAAKSLEARRRAATRYTEKHPEAHRKAVSRYNKKNPDVNRKSCKRYKEKHPDAIKKAAKLYYAKKKSSCYSEIGENEAINKLTYEIVKQEELEDDNIVEYNYCEVLDPLQCEFTIKIENTVKYESES